MNYPLQNKSASNIKDLGSFCGWVGGAVIFESRGLRLESSYRQKFILNIFCQLYRKWPIWKFIKILLLPVAKGRRPRNYLSCCCSCYVTIHHQLGQKSTITFVPELRGPRFEETKCKVVPLKARTSIKADSIFSGTVQSFYVKQPNKFLSDGEWVLVHI